MTAKRVLYMLMLFMSLCLMFDNAIGAAVAASSEDTALQQQAEDNSSAIRRLAEVMKNLVVETSQRRCLGTGTSAEQLTESIKEGFSVLVGAVQDLNNTMRHFKEDLSKKFGGSKVDSAFENDGPCPSPFFLAGEDCIYIETETLRYFDAARQACIDMGAKLAEFSTFEPFIAAVTAMDMHDEAEIYTGGTDRDSEGTWRWLSGRRIEDIPWAADEPNNADGREHCLTLRERDHKFNDVPCSFRNEYVCMYKE